MFEFNFFFPTKITFGKGKINELPNSIKQFGDKVLIVCGQNSARNSGLLDKVISVIKNSGCEPFVYEGVTTNPTKEIVLNGVKELLDYRCNSIVSLGGGSSHDAAKAISLMTTHEGGIEEYTVTGNKSVPGIKDKLIPIFTIPTISGTGAEISPASLVRLNGTKSIIFSPYLFPKNTFIDTNFINSTSGDLIVRVGIDAFFQGFEAFVASNSQPFSDKFALSAMKKAITYLPILKNNPNNEIAKANIAIAAIDSLLAVSNSGVGAIHALSDPLSGIYNIHHGIAQVIVGREVIKYNLPSFEPKLKDLIELFGVNFSSISETNLGNEFINLYDSFIDNLELSTSKYILEIKSTTIDYRRLIEDSKNPDMATNPTILTSDEIESIFRKILQ